MKRIYISGRIKGYDGFLEHFAREQEVVEGLGYEVVNPCELGEMGFTYEQYMKVDLQELLTCDAIYMLDGWENSSGARIEFVVATVCGMPVYYEMSNPLNFPSKS